MQEDPQLQHALDAAIRRAQADPGYRATLIADPAAALAAAGVGLPPGLRIAVAETSPGGPLRVTAVRPDGQLDDSALDVSAAGSKVFQRFHGTGDTSE